MDLTAFLLSQSSLEAFITIPFDYRVLGLTSDGPSSPVVAKLLERSMIAAARVL